MSQNISNQIQSIQKQVQNCFTQPTNTLRPNKIQNAPQNSPSILKMQQMIKIFINSLKLNQKIYNSIVEKQAEINSGASSFLLISAQRDSKIQEALNRTKQLYEDTVHQNQKARFMLEQFITPIRQQIKSKVDQTTFTLQMKMLLDEYDLMGHQISYDVTEQEQVKQKKRKSVNSQTLTFLRDKILPVLSYIEQRLQATINQGNTIQKAVSQLNTKTIELESKLSMQQQIIDSLQSKSLKSASDRINDHQADKKIKDSVKLMINDFSEEFHVIIQKLSRSIKNMQSNFSNQVQTIKSSLLSSMTNQKASQNYFKTHLDKNQKKIAEHSKLLDQHSLQFSIFSNKLQDQEQNVHITDKLQKKLQDLTHRLQKGKFKSENQLKGPQLQNLLKKLQDFQVNSKRIKQFQKDFYQRNITLKGQMQSIRDILSKKANFSDILLHIEGKVDKRQFKELKLKVFEEEKDFKSELMNNQLLGLKQSEVNRHWKKRHLKSKSLLSPSAIQKLSDQESEPQQVKRFKLGFTHEFLLSEESLKNQLSKSQNLRKTFIKNNSKFDNKKAEK